MSPTSQETPVQPKKLVIRVEEYLGQGKRRIARSTTIPLSCRAQVDTFLNGLRASDFDQRANDLRAAS